MLNREEIVEKLMKGGVGNKIEAEVHADLLLAIGPSNFTDMQCNFSALMYLLTEQQALIGNLLEELVRAQVLNSVSLERVTNIYGNEETLTPVYGDLYKRFVWYFGEIKKNLTEESKKKTGDWNPAINLEPNDDIDPA